jgi:hypothetical protein
LSGFISATNEAKSVFKCSLHLTYVYEEEKTIMRNRLLILAIALAILAMWQTPNARADYVLSFVQTITNGVNEDYIYLGNAPPEIVASGGLTTQVVENWWNIGYSGNAYYYNVYSDAAHTVLIDRVIAQLGPTSTTFAIQTGSAITSLPAGAIDQGNVTATGSYFSLSLGGSMTDSAGPITVDTYFEGPLSPTPIPGAAWLFGSGLAGLIGLKRKYLA